MTRINESTRINKKTIHKELSYATMEVKFEVHNIVDISEILRNSEMWRLFEVPTKGRGVIDKPGGWDEIHG